MKEAALLDLIKDSLLNKKETKTGYNKIFAETPVPDDRHEFLFFIKPEITQIRDPRSLQAVLKMMLQKISQFDLHIQNIIMLTAAYLDKYDIMARHYGVINLLSREPLKYLSADARLKFTEIYGKKPEDQKIVGGLEFLQLYPSTPVDALGKLWQSGRSAKLAGGTYCAPVTFRGEELYLINGFHPEQLKHFTAEGRCIIAFTLTGNIEWSIARNHFIGKTKPEEAMEGSLRRELLVKKEQFGLNEVSAGFNGFHLSAGPVEGLVELMRYCSDFARHELKTPGDFVFGRQLNANFTDKETAKICSNEVVIYKGNKIGTFDLTEEQNSADAIRLLKESNWP